MANNNHVPADMMAASYWQHAPVSDMYRQTQVDDYAVPQAHHHAIPMPPRNPMQNGSGTAISTPASIDSSAVGGGAATLSAETLQEEDLDGLGPLAAPASGKPIRRRMRMITSCFECRRRKLGCDRTRPCRNCDKFGTKCVYLNSNLDSASQHRLTQIKEKVGSLERQLERDVAKGRTGVNGSSAANDQQNIVADEVDDEEERELQITPLTALDLTYDDYADNTDDLVDLGVRVGRMRITERIGGLNRPRISEEVRTSFQLRIHCHQTACR